MLVSTICIFLQFSEGYCSETQCAVANGIEFNGFSTFDCPSFTEFNTLETELNQALMSDVETNEAIWARKLVFSCSTVICAHTGFLCELAQEKELEKIKTLFYASINAAEQVILWTGWILSLLAICATVLKLIITESKRYFEAHYNFKTLAGELEKEYPFKLKPKESSTKNESNNNEEAGLNDLKNDELDEKNENSCSPTSTVSSSDKYARIPDSGKLSEPSTPDTASCSIQKQCKGLSRELGLGITINGEMFMKESYISPIEGNIL